MQENKPKENVTKETQSGIAQSRPVNISEVPAENNFYINGFSIKMSIADCLIILLRNDQAVGAINLSHTVAKTLSNQLWQLVEKFEKKSGQNVYKLEELIEKFSEQNET